MRFLLINHLHIKSLHKFLPGILFVLYYALGQGVNYTHAQTSYENKRADSYFENNEFVKAIQLYKKDADKNDIALKKLADCYRIIRDYSQAEVCYAKLASKSPADMLIYYYYGQSLLHNNKYDEAKKQFLLYASFNPNDKRGNLYAKACDELKEILTKPALYKIYNMEELNSPVADFCPVFYKNGIVFTSERIRDLINHTANSFTGNPYLSLLFAKESREPINNNTDSLTTVNSDTILYNKAILFSDKFSGDGYYGPACFNADFSEIYFTKVDNSISFKHGTVNKPKLYWSKYHNGWSKPEELPFNNSDYSTEHPAISLDGQYLYFTSNMPGGKGGTDIWVSMREGDSWGSPKNLGAEINTGGNEAFPYISPNGTLYFSSDELPGYGGLDLFASTQKNNRWGKASHMMPPINSSGDDFGIVFRNDSMGYFSSNRIGGIGGDDIYSFALTGKLTHISGKILLSNNINDGVKNLRVFLITENGSIQQTTSTDESGSFSFDNLLSNQNYTLRIDETDPRLKTRKKCYLANANNKVVRVITKGKDGFFIFKNLPPDLSTLSELIEKEVPLKKISIAGNLYAGDKQSPLENAKVLLKNSKNEIVQTTITNDFGSFVFINIPPDENYTIVLDTSDPQLATKKILFTNKDGKQISHSDTGNFKYKMFASDTNTMSVLQVEEKQLLIDIRGGLFSDKEGKNLLRNIKIHLTDEKNNIVATTKTDAKGGFRFTNLAADKNYTLRLQEDDPSINLKNVFLVNSHGKTIATLKSANGKYFQYRLLPGEEQSLAYIYFDDPWLQLAKTKEKIKQENGKIIIKNIYFEFKKLDLSPQAVITLNKVVRVMQENPNIHIDIISHTDSRGTDEFNMNLSQQRAQSAVNYISSHGIEKHRMTPIGKGESELINKCKDNVDCTEAEHAQNRRTEFVVRNLKKEK